MSADRGVPRVQQLIQQWRQYAVESFWPDRTKALNECADELEAVWLTQRTKEGGQCQNVDGMQTGNHNLHPPASTLGDTLDSAAESYARSHVRESWPGHELWEVRELALAKAAFVAGAAWLTHGREQTVTPPARNDWRLDERGALDDVVVDDVATFRLERMSDDHVWGAVYRRDGSRTVFNLCGDRLSLEHEHESPAAASLPSGAGERCDGTFEDHPASQFPDSVKVRCQREKGHDGPCCSLAELELKARLATARPSAAPLGLLNEAQAWLDSADGNTSGWNNQPAIPRELVRKLLAQLRAGQGGVVSPWQPIETAPVDQTLIVCAHPEHGVEIRSADTARHQNGGGYRGPELGCAPYWYFTHWMPLPTPPAGDVRLAARMFLESSNDCIS